ncbi:uncharacterized protein LOC124264173 [Haliotis rubra]|uniref:uncharacterized protein LOC124264173 n=1 Tax=Haliotis rubra TaxID=36100 RepID=UPI001EE52800|nr:uncharacterized protein LOC124264173 [Haliotis rubra]
MYAVRSVLVKCGDSQKPVRLKEPWTRQHLMTVIVERFNLSPATPTLLQVYDPSWEAYVDLEDGDDIPDRSRVTCIVNPNIYSSDMKLDQCPNRGVTSHSKDIRITYTNNVSPKFDSVKSEKCVQLPYGRQYSEHSVKIPFQTNERSFYAHPVQENNVLGDRPVLLTHEPEADALPSAPPGVSVPTPTSPFSAGSPAQDEPEDADGPLTIDLSGEELVPLSDDGQNDPEDLEYMPEVHFQTSSWPCPYVLPSDIFPQKLKRALENQEQLDWSLRHILVQGIADSILRYTTYPSQSQKKEVISALFERYPYLAIDGANSFKRWNHIFTEKFKNIRRKMNTPEVVRRKRKRSEERQSEFPAVVDARFVTGFVKNDALDDESLDIQVYENSSPINTSHTDDNSQDKDPAHQAEEALHPSYFHSTNRQSINDAFSSNPRREEIISQFENSFGNNPLSWPHPYTLPKKLFPPVLLNALESKQVLDGPKMNLLIRCLSDGIQPYTIIPSVKQREEVVEKLVNEYPQLRDNTTTGWNSHFIKLSERFKNIRRRIMPGRRPRTFHNSAFAVHHIPPLPSPGETGSVDISNIKIEIN